ncbi:PfkB family carbohydrate kinase [Lacisediminihabitans changchengi]|uniref:Carbohydrate kinase n=1 Tax=Lacisediminihabitans changchengi TaxID=2787634 RepID=A0A934SLX3_9MICO|nr:PfkB family carbohydrate kinase [Lacisediminihabitans changchengi]MBK4349041.1 carbohydrate kinase [Lacisediminihabitans changchengi]
MSPRVLVVGEALVDLVQTAEATQVHAGGSPLNVAYGLGRLGVPTELLTEFGDDAYGTLLARHLGAASVGVVRPAGGQRATSSATAVIGTDGAARYTFDVTSDLGRQPLTSRAPFIHTGSIAAMIQPSARSILELFASTANDAVLSYDPNIRPAVMGKWSKVRPAVDELIRHSHVVKMSDEDAAWLFPDLRQEAVIDHVLSLGASLVALTLGAHGCVIASPGARIHRPAKPTKVVDTVGAGDAFMSALLFAISSEVTVTPGSLASSSAVALASIADTALASAALTVARAGALPPTLHELLGSSSSFTSQR